MVVVGEWVRKAKVKDAKKWFDENHGDGSSVFVARSQEYAVRA